MTQRQSMYDILFHRAAANEYIRARKWYSKEGGDRLADRFREEVDEAVDEIARNPEIGPVFRATYRWVRLHRFPYLLYYQILDASRLMILAVAHSARRPGYWLRRAK